MPDVPNWVKDRAQCNLDLTFKAIFDIATRDIQEAHKVDAITKGKFTFDIQLEDRTNVPTFTVRRLMNGSPLDNVLFEQGRNGIRSRSRMVPILSWSDLSGTPRTFAAICW